MIRNVIEYLQKSAKCYPDKIAIIDDEKQITFKELEDRALAIASVIYEKLEGKKNRPIAVYMKKGADCIVAFMAIVYSGNFYSPIDIHSPKDRIKLIFNVLDPEMILTASEIEIDYEEFCDDMMNDYPGDWEMETIKCTNCHKEVVIGNIEWD